MSQSYEALYEDGEVKWLTGPPNVKKARLVVTVLDEPTSALSPTEQLARLKADLLQLKPILQQQHHITDLGIFGSYVRGEQTFYSDVDILISFDPDFQIDLMTYCKIENEISDVLGKKVDLVTKQGLKPHVGEQILKEVIYLWQGEISGTTSKIFSTTSPPQSV